MKLNKTQKEKLRAAIATVLELSDEQREAIAVIVEAADIEGDYRFDGEGSVWEESASQTLANVAREFRTFRQVHDPESIHSDPDLQDEP